MLKVDQYIKCGVYGGYHTFSILSDSALQHTKTGFLDSYELLKLNDEYPDTLMYRSTQFDKNKSDGFGKRYFEKVKY